MAWCRLCDKPLSEPKMVKLPTHICVTRPRWVHLFKQLGQPGAVIDTRRLLSGCTPRWYLKSNQTISLTVVIHSPWFCIFIASDCLPGIACSKYIIIVVAYHRMVVLLTNWYLHAVIVAIFDWIYSCICALMTYVYHTDTHIRIRRTIMFHFLTNMTLTRI